MNSFLEFASNHPILVPALVASFFVVVFTELRRRAQGIVNLEPAAAVRLMNADATVIDLRSVEAFNRGHIVNAKNIPFDQLESQREKIDRLAAKPVIAVCETGMQSSRAVATLRKAGLDNVYGLKGGIAAWTQANQPLVGAKKTRGRK